MRVENSILEGDVIENRYKIIKEISYGNSGESFFAIEKAAKSPVFVKVKPFSDQSIKKEAFALEDLYSNGKGKLYVPKVLSKGSTTIRNHKISYIVMESLGKDLNTLFIERGKKFSLKTVLVIAENLIKTCKYIHHVGYLHRDIKPKNIVLGKSKRNRNYPYLIDFETTKRIRPKKKRFEDHIGTKKFGSIRNLLGKEMDRRDDLISIGYMLIFFLTGSLPWSKVLTKLKNHPKEEKVPKSMINKIIKMKKNVISYLDEHLDEHDICVVSTFSSYFSYLDNLKVSQTPDYSYLQSLFRTLRMSLHFNNTIDTLF